MLPLTKKKWKTSPRKTLQIILAGKEEFLDVRL